MTDSVVVYVDISGIQEYLFGSNRLRENIGASYFVKQASTTWVDQAKPSGVKIFAGGGKACVLFHDQASAKAWTKAYTRRALKETPGLRVAVGHSAPFEYDPNQSDLIEHIQQAQDDAKRIESRYAPFAPTLGLGVTVPCRSTGLVAVGQRRDIDGVPKDEGDYPVSNEIIIKTRSASYDQTTKTDAAMHDLKTTITAFQAVEPLEREALNHTQHYLIPRDFDDFGRREGDYSYLAVVHMDGNAVGTLFRTIGRLWHDTTEQCEQYVKNESYIAAYQAFSNLVDQSGVRAINAMIECLMTALKYSSSSLETSASSNASLVATITKDLKRPMDQAEFRRFRRLPDERDKTAYFPLRPLVYGSDDSTFVCDARLAAILTPYLIERFEYYSQHALVEFKQQFTEIGAQFPDKLTACAGITIFKTHYPFARAYALCEELCQSAKKFSDL